MEYAIIIPESILLMVILAMLWQLWQKIEQLPKNEDEPIGEDRAKEITKRLHIMSLCLAVEAILLIAQSVLRYFA